MLRAVLFLMLVALLIYLAAGNGGPSGRFHAYDLTLDQGRMIAAQIRAKGFNCPEAKLGIPLGETARGTAVRIYCGPEGGNGVYPNDSFRVISRGGDYMVSPTNEKP